MLTRRRLLTFLSSAVSIVALGSKARAGSIEDFRVVCDQSLEEISIETTAEDPGAWPNVVSVRHEIEEGFVSSVFNFSDGTSEHHKSIFEDGKPIFIEPELSVGQSIRIYLQDKRVQTFKDVL